MICNEFKCIKFQQELDLEFPSTSYSIVEALSCGCLMQKEHLNDVNIEVLKKFNTTDYWDARQHQFPETI